MTDLQTVKQNIEQLCRLLEGELPAPTHQVGSCQDVLVPCRDGVPLMTRIILPQGDGPWPVIVSRNPYTPVDDDNYMQIGILALVRYGYGVVYQQVRGLYHSQGTWSAFANEREDGLDLLQWAADQTWCDGRICLYGGSYLGHVIWSMADALPPQVKTMYTLVWGDDPYRSFYENGMFKQATWTLWAMQMMHPEDRDDLSQPDLEGFKKAMDVVPQIKADEKVCGCICPWYRSWITQNSRTDPYWEQGDWKHYSDIASKIRIPVLMQTGWFDIFLEPTVSAFSHLTSEVRARSKLVIGPWHHGNTASGTLSYPEENHYGSFQIKLALEWFNHVLSGDSDPDVEPGIDTYVVGANRWRHWTEKVKSSVHRFFLLPGCAPEHRLSSKPDEKSSVLTYLYDPADPVPSQGGKLLMNYRQWLPEPECAAIQPAPGKRDDVCSFLSDRLDHPVTLIGQAAVHLTVCSDAPDTAFTAKLMEIRTDGSAVNVCDGIATLAFRKGEERRISYTPGQQASLSFQLPPAAWQFGSGSRIRLDISSSNYPAFHRHPNTAVQWALATDYVCAQQTLYVGRDSWIDLPLEDAVWD